MDQTFKEHIAGLLGEAIKNFHHMTGGDISQAFKITTEHNHYFIKINTTKNALNMFQKEADGLRLINEANTIKTPRVLLCNTFENASFLLMEFIDSKTPSSLDFKNLGIQLAQLHQVTSEQFGLHQDNLIGSLPQSNSKHTSWMDFYTKERLIRQLELAKQNGFLSPHECPSEKHIKERLESLFLSIKPSLLHGDLWSGNYLISKKGEPYLIDPAIYFGHHEVDIAMTKLFGGFGKDFYDSYHSIFPDDKKTPSRIEIYQLYYLLVHLNLFGKSYYPSVSSILKKHF